MTFQSKGIENNGSSQSLFDGGIQSSAQAAVRAENEIKALKFYCAGFGTP
jgi:hypothetical protein